MDQEKPSLKTYLWRGAKCRCPNCGEGKLFKAFLKVTDRCDVCGEEYYHHRADDLPAYLVILFTGHLFVMLALDFEIRYAPPFWVHIVIWFPSLIIASLLLLQPVKGMVVALQWHMGMHGFRDAKLRRDEKLISNQR